MKKVMILTALAALAISGNAMALATPPGGRAVFVDGGLPSGNLVFSPLVRNVAPTLAAPFGSCRYDGAWFAAAPFFGTPLSCSINEPKQFGHLSCSANRAADFLVPNVTSVAGCSGFDSNGEAFPVLIAATETPLGVIGSVIFDGALFPEAILF